MKQPEARFKSKLVEIFEELYPTGWCTYVNAPKYGVPDLVFAIPGHRECWVEAKANGGVLSSYQKLVHKKMRAAGQTVRVMEVEGVTPGSKWHDWSILVHRLDGVKTSVMSAPWLRTTSFWKDLCS